MHYDRRYLQVFTPYRRRATDRNEDPTVLEELRLDPSGTIAHYLELADKYMRVVDIGDASATATMSRTRAKST